MKKTLLLMLLITALSTSLSANPYVLYKLGVMTGAVPAATAVMTPENATKAKDFAVEQYKKVSDEDKAKAVSFLKENSIKAFGLVKKATE